LQGKVLRSTPLGETAQGVPTFGVGEKTGETKASRGGKTSHEGGSKDG